MQTDMLLFTGNANPSLAAAVAAELHTSLAACTVERFPDGEVSVRLDTSVRGRDVFLLQPTAPPVNEHLMELLLLADACRRAAAGRITAIVPYFGYARSDKRLGRREPITASMVARLLQLVGIGQILTLDLHTPQIEGFFHVPVDSLTAVPILAEAARPLLTEPFVVVSPDTGRVRMATEYAHQLGAPVVVLHKQRESGSETQVTHIVGEVRDQACLIVDDMISTGGTLARSVEALLQAGARPEMVVAATHGVFVSGAREHLSHSCLRAILVTDSISVSVQDWPLLRIVSVAPLLATAIQQLIVKGSLRSMV
jgi:ribose-phosphate pyrophosphokinase